MQSKSLITILIIACFCNSVKGQSDNNKAVSVEKQLLKSKEFLQKSLDSALFYVDNALKVAESISNDTLIAKSRLQKSSVHIRRGAHATADSLLQLNLLKSLPNHLKGQTLHNLATISYYKKELKKALEIYLEAAEVLERTKDSGQLVNTYANIGSINAQLRNFENAQKYLERALPLTKTDEILKLQILVNLSNIYYNLKSFDKYTERIFEAERLAKKFNAISVLSVIYTNLSTYYTEDKKDYNEALKYGLESIQLKKKLNSRQTLDVSYNSIGLSYLKKGEYQKAVTYLDSALLTAKSTLKTYVYNNLKESYQGMKDYQKALEYANLMNAHKDSITEQNQKQQVAELTEKYESEKKQQQIDILDTKNKLQALTINQQRYILFGLGIFGLLFMIMGYFWFKNYKTKKQLDTILLQQKLRKTQLNPHFLFNALQSIQSFIFNNEKEKSVSYLSSYSKLIRSVLEKSEENFITVEEDKIALESYLNLQQLTHNNSFSYTISVSENVQEDFDMLPTLITQPFVENAVLHGIKNIENGKVSIHYFKENDLLCIAIKDNGKGFNLSQENSKKLHKSMSSGIIKEQLKNLENTSKNFTGSLDIDSSPSGTKVILRFTLN